MHNIFFKIRSYACITLGVDPIEIDLIVIWNVPLAIYGPNNLLSSDFA